MGLAIPQVITPSKASGAQIIDGSLKFDKNKTQHLKKTFGSEGNRNVWTWSSWAKRGTNDAQLAIFSAHTATNNAGYGLIYLNQNSSDATFNFNNWDGGSSAAETSAVLRDTNGWYHLVVRHDEDASPKAKLYINGQLQSLSSNLSTSTGISDNIEHRIGHEVYNDRKPFDGAMSQCYFIDGQSLGPEEFGFTDPLTNTWKPKKFSGNFTQSSANDGTTWSSSVSGPVNSSKPLSLLFGGTIGSGYQNGTTPTSGNTLTFDISSKNLTVTNVRLNTFISTGPGGGGTPNTFTLNGTTVPIADSDGDQTHVVAVNGQLNTIAWSYDSGNGPYVYMRGIEVDLGGGLGYELLTDGVNNTGVNSFYLPMDGNSPIGKDQSGNGNDWTPVNFGGSMELDNPNVSGARPILNTTQGGSQAGVGVFGSRENVGYAVTVYNDGGGNKYYIDGVKQDTVTGLIRGATYTFDTSDSTVSSHPFRFSATSNGSHGGGSEYTNGVAAITGAATTITVPHDAPNTLYYYCTSHSGMGADITGITTNEKLADQYASHVTLALPLVGGATDTSASIACTMTNKAVTVSGAAVDSSESNFYSGSFVFDGSNDQLSYTAGSDFDFGGGDFTLETWINMDSISAGQAILEYSGQSSATSPDGQWYFSTSNGWHWYHSSSAYAIIPKARVPTDKWIHLALVREGDVLTHYLNGVCEASSAYTRTDAGSSSRALIIGQQNSSSYFDGHLQDYRIYKGVAKYSGTTVGTQYFVPASTSPDILPDTPSGVAGGSKLTKITDGAVSFDGTNDYLTIADSDDFNLGSGAFTIEGFCYLRSSSAQQFLVGMWTGNQLSYAVQTSNDANRYLRFLISDDGTGVDFDKVSTGSLRLNGWSHFAVTRSGNTFYLFVDGILVGTQSASNTLHNSTGTLAIGARNDGTQDLNGFISNVRIIKGTALYTSRFTPPTAPLTNVTNTKLLTCQSTSLYAAVAPLVSGVNNGTVWSSSLTGDSLFRSGYPAVDAFNGVTKTSTEDCAATPQVTGQGFTFTFGGGVPFTTLQMQCDHNNGTTVTANGVNITSQLSSGSLTNTTITGVTSPLTSLSVVSHNGDAGYLGSVTIDGTMLVDPFVPNGDAAATNFNPFNTDINTVRGQETEYCTWNPLAVQPSGHGGFRDGNLEIIASTDGSGKSTLATFPIPSTGKWYWEVQAYRTGSTSNGGGAVGVAEASAVQATAVGGGSGNRLGEANSSSWVFSLNLFDARHRNTADYSNYLNGGTAVADTGIIGIAVDMDNDKMWAHYNGVYGNAGGIGNPVTGANPAFSGEFSGLELFPAGGIAVDSGSGYIRANWGQKPFSFSPPEGYQALNAANVRPETVILRPNQYVGISTWSGNNVDGRLIETSFEPDLVWQKRRDGSSNHNLYDTIRGAGKRLSSDSDGTEENQATPFLKTFEKNGFTVNNDADINGSSGTHVAWCWKAGGSSNTFNVDGVGYATAAAAGLTAGTMTVTGSSVGTKQGFSILTYTGTNSNESIPHGLDSAPSFYIVKARENSAYTDFWSVYHQSLGKDAYIKLNSTAAASTSSNIWNNTAPTDSLFYVRSDSIANENNIDYVAYLWHDVPGLQKFGTYEGSGVAGNYVHLGFRPALIWIKNADATLIQNWGIIDSTRSFANVGNHTLATNLASAESAFGDGSSVFGANNKIDLLSDGFRLQETSGFGNTSGITFIYCAWAEAPSIDLYGGGANAR